MITWPWEKKRADHNLATCLTLLAMVMILPSFNLGYYFDVFFWSFLNLLLLYVVRQINRSRPVIWLGTVFVASYIVLMLLSFILSSLYLMAAANAVLCLYVFYAIFFIGKNTYAASSINWNLIFGAVSIYLLLAFALSRIYWLVEMFFPNSFQQITPIELAGHDFAAAFEAQFDLVFFSYTALTGFGSAFLPLTTIARAISILEIIFGHLFMGIAIAKLVSVWHIKEVHKFRIVERKGFASVLILVLLIMFFVPVIFRSDYSFVIAQALFNLIILVFMYKLTVDYERGFSVPKGLIMILVFIIPSIVLEILGIHFQSLHLIVYGVILLSLFLIFSIVFLIRKVIKVPVIDTNLLFGALTIYLLVGILWSKWYWLANVTSEGTFSGVVSLNLHSRDISRAIQSQFDLLYYSFGCITSAGFGDIIPKHHLVKSMTMLESIMGQVVLTVIISKIVFTWRPIGLGASKKK